MKQLSITLLSVALLAGGNLFAEDKAPDKAPVKSSITTAVPDAGLKITKITGTVQLMKDGLVVMTLKPGDALPSLVDANMTFNVIDGSIEVEAGGEKITGGSGANFTVNAEKSGEVKISVAAGAPVEVKGASGSSVVLTQNTDVKMTKTGAKMDIAVEKGSALVTTASGEKAQSVKAGETATLTAAAGSVVAPTVPAVTEEPEASAEAAVLPPPFVPETTVIETQTVQESCEVSGSTPGCNP